MSADRHPNRIPCTLRAATPADIPDIARIFLAGLDTSLPDRKLASEFYMWERDVVPDDGRLRRRLAREQEEERVVVAVVEDRLKVGGYTNWRDPSIREGKYTPGEVNITL
jgi:hypothetical protein